MIELLLEEYKALRGEVNQRIAERTHLAAAAGAIAAILTVTGGFFVGGRLYVVITLAVFVAIWSLWGTRAQEKIGAHLTQLEDRINALAARAYGAQDVFTWEHGVGAERRRKADRRRRLFRRH